jgi:arginine deiminase
MNQCIINVVDKSIFIAFEQIVEKGSIEVWNTEGNKDAVAKREILNSNFENLCLKLKRGKYKVEISIDGQQIIKTININ